jgi:uncharacterized protein YdbL (DUF1318 family)
MKRWICKALVIAVGCYPLFAFALTLADAKRQGLVGEQPNGYLGVVGEPTPEVATLVNKVNGQRRLLYVQAAEKAGITLPEMENYVGIKEIDQTARGQYYRNAAGTWVKK